jgi:hypothetical protein
MSPLLGHKPSLWITHKENGSLSGLFIVKCYVCIQKDTKFIKNEFSVVVGLPPVKSAVIIAN